MVLPSDAGMMDPVAQNWVLLWEMEEQGNCNILRVNRTQIEGFDVGLWRMTAKEEFSRRFMV